MDAMDAKKADNEIIELKNRINELDNKMQEEIDNLSRNIDACIDFLSKSIKGGSICNTFNNMSETNTMLHIKTVRTIQDETEDTQKHINKLYGEKESAIKEERNKYKKEVNQ